MLNRVIAFSLRNRPLIASLAVVVLAGGAATAARARIDVLPDLNRPTVTVMTEVPGLPPEEVESRVTFPLEMALNGATGVQRIRSTSAMGLSILRVEFDWGADIYRARWLVSEKVNGALDLLPQGAHPVLTPVSSIMGEILLIGVSAGDEGPSLTDLHTLADWTIRPRLLSIPGVAQVTVIGGRKKQYEVRASPDRMRRYRVTMDELVEAVRASSANAGGGFWFEPTREHSVRIVGRVTSAEEIAEAVVRAGNPAPLRVKHVADVAVGNPIPRGDAAIAGRPAVLLAVSKQPEADTRAVTALVDEALRELAPSLPAGARVHDRVFRQQEFIDAAVENVLDALRDGALLVAAVLLLFLWNVRASAVSLATLPVSFLATVAAFGLMGVGINTMTLGGLAVAVGELVDDSIVDVENIFRRLRENRRKAAPEPALRVVFRACTEVRNSIVYATAILLVVVVPLLQLGGVEGRLFAPIAIAYALSLAMSLVVSLTVTPALASWLLPRASVRSDPRDPPILARAREAARPLVRWSVRHPLPVLAGAGGILGAAAVAAWGMRGEFLPPFQEGTFTVNVIAPPGTSLDESNRIGGIAEEMIQKVPEVVSTARRTGRAELDEHAEGVNYSEFEVRVRGDGRSREEIAADLRDRLAYIPGVWISVGQPISHRIDHLLSGARAQVAVKIFGPDIELLRAKAQDLYERMAKIRGVADLQIEPQVEVPQLQIRLKHEALRRYGLTAGGVAETLSTALAGKVVSEVLEGESRFDLVVWLDPAARGDPEAIGGIPVSVGASGPVPLRFVADVARSTGPNAIQRESLMRRILVSCNIEGRDLAGVAREIRAAEKELKLPTGYFVRYGGEIEAREEAVRRLAFFGGLALLVVFALLLKALGTWQAAAQCLVNLPLAFAGGVLAIRLFGDRTMSVASLVGLLTLTGIVMRNGILIISHYLHLVRYEGEVFGEALIVRGTLERLAPVLMTAATTVLGLLPLAVGGGETGKELLHPLALTVIGGMVVSTLLDQMATPALFALFGKRAVERALRGGQEPPASAEAQEEAR